MSLTNVMAQVVLRWVFWMSFIRFVCFIRCLYDLVNENSRESSSTSVPSYMAVLDPKGTQNLSGCVCTGGRQLAFVASSFSSTKI